MSDTIYLDYNATTPLRPAARKAMERALDSPLNASAAHRLGQAGRKIIEDARTIIANAINAPTTGIIFNSGATESNNTVLQHFARLYPDERILIGATEHAAVQEALPDAQKIPVDSNGVIDLGAFEDMLKDDPKTSLVSVMLANNETGTIQPLAEISALAHKYGALVHSDATQALGKIEIDLQALGIDFMSLSSHKVGGTQGTGALAIGTCGITPVLLYGGGQEKNARGGTENIAGIAAFAAATDEAVSNLDAEHARLSALRDHLETRIRDTSPEAVIFAHDVTLLPNTTLFAVAGMKAETLVMNFDLEGIAVSSGSACSSGTVKQSRILNAMDIPDNIKECALRISTGWNTSQEDIESALNIWQKIYSRMKG